MIPARVTQVPQDECPVCHATNGLVNITLGSVRAGRDPFLEGRSAIITGIITGLRRDELELCAQCKEILEKGFATIEALYGATTAGKGLVRP